MTKAHRSIVLIFSIAINCFDVILHIAIGQPEALRITGNLFIIISSALLLVNPRYSTLFTVALSLYVGLNTLFIVLEGIGPVGALFIGATMLTGLFIIRPIKTHQVI
jgi:hypothetical protein